MSTALVRYDQEKPRGLLGRLRGAMQKWALSQGGPELEARLARLVAPQNEYGVDPFGLELDFAKAAIAPVLWLYRNYFRVRSEEHTSELQSQSNLVCRLLLDKKKKENGYDPGTHEGESCLYRQCNHHGATAL